MFHDLLAYYAFQEWIGLVQQLCSSAGLHVMWLLPYFMVLISFFCLAETLLQTGFARHGIMCSSAGRGQN